MTESTAHLGITRPRRRLRWAAAAGAGLLLAAVVPGLATGAVDSSFVSGSGNAYAQFARVGPTAARLSLAPVVGLSLSDYVGSVGRGQATDADLAAIGVASPCTAKSIPTLRVTSTDPGAAKGKTEFFQGMTDASGRGGGFGELYARATGAPFGESSFRLSSFAIPGLIAVGGGTAQTSAGVFDSNVRRSTATVEISSFGFGGGLIGLTGLRWSAVQQTGAGGKIVTGSFTVQGATIGGVPMSIPAGGSDLASVLGPLNAAIAPTGFALRPPTASSLGGLASVTPLSIEIVNSPLGRQFLAPVLGAAQPIREPLAAQLLSLLAAPSALNKGNPNDCSQQSVPDLTAGVLVADLAVGIAAGSSDFHIELGGVNAYTEGELFTNPFLNAPSLPPIAGAATVNKIVVPGTAGRPGTPGSGPYDTGLLTAAAPPGIAGRNVPGSRGGAAIAVGLIGLAVAAGLAAADWARMRSARGIAEN